MAVKPTTLDAYQLIHDGVLCLGRAEQVGIRVDVQYCEQKKEFLTKKIERSERLLKETEFMRDWRRKYGASFNMHSNQQLEDILYNVMGLKAAKETTSGAGSTDEDTLGQLGIPELDSLIQVRKLKKIRDTYIDAFLREQVNGILHPFFNLHTTKTYRSSSNSPNFQNIPKRDKEAMKICRRALKPRPGNQLLEVDFSGLEVSIAACYHKDKTMMKYLTSDHSDMHSDLAEQLFIIPDFDKVKYPEHKHLRNASKNGFIFPQFYGDYYGNNAVSLAVQWAKLGQGAWGPGQGVAMPGGLTIGDHFLSKGIRHFDQFVQHVKAIEEDFWGKRFWEYQKWKERWLAQYQKAGYFDLKTGFRCTGVMRKNEVINYAVQGAAFHCLLWSFIQVDRIITERKMQSRLIGQIHDALIVDVVPEELDELGFIIRKVTCVDLAKHWKWIIVPLDVEADICEVDAPWSEKHGHKLPEVV